MTNHRERTFLRCSLPTDAASLTVLRNLEEQGLLCADHRLTRGDREIVALRSSEVSLLEQSGIAVDVLSESGQTSGPAATSSDTIGTGFVSAYLDSPSIDAAYANLHSLFPALTSISDLPEITTGYDGSAAALVGPSPVKVFRITTTPALASKPGLLIVAGLHAREWAPPLAAIEFASQLLHNYDPSSMDPDVVAINAIVENIDVFIVGAANPDGIDYSHHDEALWRKNRRPNGGSPMCPGVDNNRNFSVYWGQAGSTSDPCDHEVFHGPFAFSEVENRNVRSIVEQFPNILTAIDCHSFGEKFFRPQPSGGTFIASEPVPMADDAIYAALETSMNAGVAAATPGKSYGTGTTSNHAGTFDEYMYFGHRIFAFEVEIGADFQPLIADALASVQEAAGAMRALAKETLNLAARFINPAAIVQVIDKSGSMISSGYVDSTRGNAERLIDLMSLNDSTAVVSFNGTAATELPSTAIVGPGSYAAAKAAVAGIAFGGSTSIGAGLQLGLSLLPPPGQPRSLLLLSDGFENTPPLVSAVLPTVPAGVLVHTIALGLASDQALLQNIASMTGGTYFFSPDELTLFEIYNAARGAIADVDMVFEDTVDPGTGDSIQRARSFTRFVVIDCDVDFADFTVAACSGAFRLDVDVRCVSVPFADLRRAERRDGPGYVVIRVRRPQPGTYQLTVTAWSEGATACSVAVFVKSPLRLTLVKPPERLGVGTPIDLHFAIRDNGHPVGGLSVSAHALCPATSIRLLAKEWKREMRLPVGPDVDRAGDEAARARSVLEHLRQRTGLDPGRPVRRGLSLVHPRLVHAPSTSMAVRVPTSKTIDGTYNVRLSIQGRTRSGCPFVRVGICSVHVG